MKTSPPLILSLAPGEIFVFGSNRAGRHGRGAAKQAMQFGAIYGQGEGLQGRAYGISTKGRNLEVLSLREIEINVERFTRFALNHPGLEFLVTEIGCGLAGFSPKQIAPMFRIASELQNVALPESFVRVLEK